MKKLNLLCVLVLVYSACATKNKAVESYSLQEGITKEAELIGKKLKKNARVASINAVSPQEALSEYVVTSLNQALAAIDKKNFVVPESIPHNAHEALDDSAARTIGQQLDTQFVITSSVQEIDGQYHLKTRTIPIGKGKVQDHAARALNNDDEQLNALLQPPELLTEETVDSAVGTPGPAGGIIFYDRGEGYADWRYLEAAPHDLDPVLWAAFGTSVLETRSAIGAGQRNTMLVTDATVFTTPYPSAAQVCNDLVIGCFDDWYLPSKDELNALYLALGSQEGFEKAWYWSSTWESGFKVWGQHFGDGTQGIHPEDTVARVRAIRAF
ncbi:MAG: DUF1566 domain-containing protein [Treponema sp.]|nr:DUF1566 domain-containing protein [Treponema sp.]